MYIYKNITLYLYIYIFFSLNIPRMMLAICVWRVPSSFRASDFRVAKHDIKDIFLFNGLLDHTYWRVLATIHTTAMLSDKSKSIILVASLMKKQSTLKTTDFFFCQIRWDALMCGWTLQKIDKVYDAWLKDSILMLCLSLGENLEERQRW